MDFASRLRDDGICSYVDFVTQMPGAEECHESLLVNNLTVFCYPGMNNSDGNIISPDPAQQPQSLQNKIKSLLLSLKHWQPKNLIQFWAPVTTKTGQIGLSVSGQPFRVDALYRGLCKYRQYCIQRGSSVEDVSQLGPPGRVFEHGSSEQFDSIESCSIDAFPIKEYATQCGISKYRAIPLFERGHHHHREPCVGVLEIVCISNWIGNPVSIENKDFVCSRSHCEECKSFHRTPNFLQYDVLKILNQADLDVEVETWVPCICDDPGAIPELNAPRRITPWFWQCPSWKWYTNKELDTAHFSFQTFYLKSGKSWVERAYSLNKPCLIRNASQCSVSNYPILSLSSDTRFAIPLKLIHSKLPPLILEIICCDIYDDDDIDDRDLKDYLKNLLDSSSSAFAKQLLEVEDITFDKKKFYVEFSHRDVDGYFYFDVSQREDDDVPETGNTAGDNKNSDFIDLTSIEEPTNAGAEIISIDTQTGESDPAAEHRGKQLLSHEYLGDERDQQLQASLNDQQAITEAESSKGVEIEIDIDRIKQCFGMKEVDAARELGVSRSTLKRRCRENGIKRWPSHKRNKANQIPSSNPRRSLDVGGEVVQEPENGHRGVIEGEVTAANSILPSPSGKGIATENKTMVVKATYADNAVKFHLCSTSSFKDLLEALNKRFELGSKRFVIKYEDKEEDDDWIMMACDEDLHFHMNALISAGESRMNLKLFPVTAYLNSLIDSQCTPQ